MKLYELTAQYRSLEALEVSEDLPPEVIRDTLEGLTGELQDKATNVALFIRNLESTAEAIDQAAETMRKRGARLRERAQSLNQYLLLNMQACGITKIECPYFTLAVKKNPPTVIVSDETALPEEYWVAPEPPPPPPKRPDKKAIAAAFKAGKEVPGAYREQFERLEIAL